MKKKNTPPRPDQPADNTRNRCTALEAQVRGLQEQVQQLQNGIKDIGMCISQSHDSSSRAVLSSSHDHGATPFHRPSPASISTHTIQSAPEPTRPQFLGPTSSDFSFSVANTALNRLGIDASPQDFRNESAVSSRAGSPEPEALSTSRDPLNGNRIPSFQDKDPLLMLGLREVESALDVYEEELHPIYPFVDVDDVKSNAAALYRQAEMSGRGDRGNGTRTCSIDTMVLKMMVAAALVVRGAGKSNTGQLLLESVDAVLDKGIRGIEMTLQQVQLFTLTVRLLPQTPNHLRKLFSFVAADLKKSIYHFHCDEETLAWRTIGIAARIALEMGLHRKESLETNFPDEGSRHWAMRLFYCIYVLDRRWSFGTGLPFALHDSDIDPELPNLVSYAHAF